MTITTDRVQLSRAVAPLVHLCSRHYPHPLRELPVKQWRTFATFDARVLCVSGVARNGVLSLSACGEDWRASAYIPCQGEGHFLAPLNLFVKVLNAVKGGVAIAPTPDGNLLINNYEIPCPSLAVIPPVVPARKQARLEAKTLLRQAVKIDSREAVTIFPKGRKLYFEAENQNAVCLSEISTLPSAALINSGDLARAVSLFDGAEIRLSVSEREFVIQGGGLAIALDLVVPILKTQSELKKPPKVLRREAVNGKVIFLRKEGDRYSLSVISGGHEIEEFVPGLKKGICREYSRKRDAEINFDRWISWQRSVGRESAGQRDAIAV